MIVGSLKKGNLVIRPNIESILTLSFYGITRYTLIEGGLAFVGDMA